MRDFYSDHARLINLILLFVAIVGLTMNFVARRSKMIRRTRRVQIWVYLIFINMWYGTYLNLRDDIRISVATTILTVLLIGLVGSLIWKPDGDDKLPPRDGAWFNRFVVWLDGKVIEYKTRHGRETV